MFQLQIIDMNKPLTTDSSYIVVTMMLIITIDPRYTLESSLH